MEVQLQALNSANDKLKAIDQLTSDQKSAVEKAKGRDLAEEKRKLLEFIKSCNEQLIGIKDLHSHLAELKLYANLLVLRLQVIPKDQQIDKHTQSCINQWIKETQVMHGSKPESMMA